MKRILLGLVLTSVLTSGCAPTKLCKPGGDFSGDMYSCKLRARQMAQFGDVYNPFVEQSELRDCMSYKGWSKCSE